ncbi:hypothetical protein V5O48_003104 [Marasmius crinis-equi]|uniref:F-box domain-containing protein n=1 Tax=Marasmius crinis-equi TaxID=585013 RepID=A0ABR3FTV4_9AGAR
MVCRLWKTVAYSTPAIWNTPDFMFPTLARNMLHRSKCTPLNIIWGPSCRNERVNQNAQDGVLTEVAEQISRIASLNIVSDSLEVASLFNSTWLVMTGAAPLLHTIQIYCHTGLEDTITIPDEFLAGRAPRLVRLSLSGCSLSWHSPLLKNLTHLSVRHPPAASKPGVRVVVDALRSLPSLVTLDLQYCISPGSGTCLDGLSVESLAFPFLRQLVLSIESDPCLSLLQCMSFPDTTIIHLACYEPPPDFPVGRLFSFISNLMAPAAAAPNHPRAIRGLALTEEASVAIIARNVDNSNLPLSDLDNADESCQLSLHVRAHHFGRTAIINSLSNLVPLTHLENLRIECGEPFPREALVQLLGQSNLLKSLFIEDYISLDFLQLFRSQKTFLPALTALTLSSLKFGDDPTPDFAPFIQGLEHRSEHDHYLKSLALIDCTGIYSNDIAEVQKWVDHVSWNGLVLSRWVRKSSDCVYEIYH